MLMFAVAFAIVMLLNFGIGWLVLAAAEGSWPPLGAGEPAARRVSGQK
jgi:hypothetical protein